MQRSPSGRGIEYLDATPTYVGQPTRPSHAPPPQNSAVIMRHVPPSPPTVTKKDHCDIYELCLIIIAFKNNQQLKKA